ncbi:hypothetical protein [Actinomycetospora sp. TBRC 11914]|uniref:hypothetical protein n=1 Tax=Actinomycetospora sp. TBRC 11914 TaxID=2729387 RepID=UPI00145CBCF7|nr:hypothetical protein [Actinomycetospora sp. TBRC 11914]NMO89521.1 hypothetical protein [Actinomycetospora sp. TBRC 11914]
MEIDHAEIVFRADGAVETAPPEIVPAGTSDVVVMAHGWNNDAAAARSLFEAWRARLADALDAVPAPTVRRVATLGVIWPSQQFALPATTTPQQLQEHLGAVAATAAPADRDALAAAGAQVPALDTADGRDAFASRLVDVIGARTGLDEPAVPLLAEGSTLRTAAGVRPTDLDPPPEGVPHGAVATVPEAAAAGLFGADSLLGGAVQLANLATFYVMKDRAGVVGEQGVGPFLAERLPADGPRLHLVGHSFGARLVTAAALSAPGHRSSAVTHSLSLLQAAFSHYAFAEKWGDPGQAGSFRGLLTQGGLVGPMLVSHTRNDEAVGLAYALASRFRDQIGSALGGPGDPYGGLGSNGAQLTPEVTPDEPRLRPVGEPYHLVPRRVHNLLADAFVHDHGDVRGPEIGHALAAAIACGATL